MPTQEYLSGGMAPVEGERIAAGPSDLIGRWLNNLSGTTANNMFNAQEAEKSRIFNATEAQKARDFEEYMSSTAYSRAVKDMQKAGLNPASLSAGNMSPASTPSGNAASSSGASATKGRSSGIIGQLIKTAVGIALMS